MYSFKGLDITAISIMIEKLEKESFHFVNPCRAWDGFVLITDGKGYAVDPRGNRHEIAPGDLLLFRQNDAYEIHLPAGGAYVTSGYDLAFDHPGDFPAGFPFLWHCSASMQKSIHAMCRLWQSRAWNSCTQCRIELLSMYLEILSEYLAQAPADEDVARAVRYIHAHFKSNFSGEELARHCSLSLSYLRAKFQKHTGRTILAYRDELRISSAREMLDSQCFTVSEIAAELGYCDIYHFSKAFKQHTGLSPTAYLQSKK